MTSSLAIVAPLPSSSPRTYGLAMRRGGFWEIAADPEAMIMLKRILVRIDRAELGQVRVKRTQEVDKLLEWFQDLFPLEMTPADRVELHRGAEEHRAQARLVGQVLAHDYVPAPFSLAVPPRDYQRVAADLWLRLGSLLLADSLGTGKTCSAITGLSDLRTRPALVVTPGGAMPRQWHDQLDRFLPGLRVFVCEGQTASTPSVRGAWPDVVICPYHLLKWWGDVLAPKIRSVVFDEVQDLRHDDTDKYRAARHLARAAGFVLGMSATPVFNYGGEYHAILDLIRPGCLGTWEEFDREWCVGTDEKRKKRVKDTAAFGLHLDRSGIRLRRTRADVGRELPPLTVVPHHIGCDPAKLAAVKGRAAELARVILEQTGAGAGAGFRKMQAAGELDRLLRQATGIGKAPFVAEFVRMLVDSGEAPVVFVHHRAVYDVLAAALHDLAPAVYSGEESPTRKREALRRFTSRETPVLLMGLRVGSAGLDGLQYVSRTVVIAELDWSPAIHHQGIGRVDRDGQPDKVTAYYLLADQGSDPTVAEVCGVKNAQQVVILDPKADRRALPEVDPDGVARLARSILERR